MLVSPAHPAWRAVLLVERVLGNRLDSAFAGRLHALEHHDGLDTVTLLPADLARRRLRAVSAKGEDVAIALAREERLFNGAILLLDQHRALVVRVDEERWLRLQPSCVAEAIELGYQAGNLHWRVRFQEGALLVALEAPVQDYLDRLGRLVGACGVTASIVGEE